MDSPVIARTFLLKQSMGCKVPAQRVNKESVKLRLELPFTDVPLEYTVPLDERERRLLVVIDGDIPWGGLPLNCDQIHESQLPQIRFNERNRRTCHQWEEPPTLRTKDGYVLVTRRFLLLASGKAIIRRYHPPSFRPQYTLLDVRKSDGKKGGLSITWCNTGT